MSFLPGRFASITLISTTNCEKLLHLLVHQAVLIIPYVLNDHFTEPLLHALVGSVTHNLPLFHEFPHSNATSIFITFVLADVS